jgi:hypothetical protein
MAASAKRKRKRELKDPRLFTLDVSIIRGPMMTDFLEKNPVISRTIEIRGGQTLDELHFAIFDAFGRDEEHLYEFRVGGKRPMDREATRYTVPMAMETPFDDGPSARDVTRTPLGSLGLKTGDFFAYWFDFGDDWWHRIDVVSIEEESPPGKYPRVTARVGKSPPQYPDWEGFGDEEYGEEEDEEEGDDEGEEE